MAIFCITGSAGHLGEALARTLREQGHHVVGLDVVASPFTGVVGAVGDRDAVRRALDGADHVLHTATLHKPHVGSHSRQDFVDTNVTGTLTVLEAAAEVGARSVVFTSSTSAFGRSLTPEPGRPAVWIDETTPSTVRNIYGATKVAAEDLCELAARDLGLPVVVLRTARFFPEPDDRDDVRAAFDDVNLKVNEFLHRRIDLADVVGAHLCAAARAPELGFGRYVISATTPFTPDDLPELAVDAAAVINRIYPGIGDDYARRGWRLPPTLDRVYSNALARRDLHWTPRYDFPTVVDLVRSAGDPRSPLARTVGAKGYHAEPTGIYTGRRDP
ncbi:NAD-dependent epimerase/dehydratase family protein [Pseudonocardia charpentierae]|uniref:NAD(P)-dependent oxidoreductase n=1 Tax=Pseudonocardia charpentierae TaxID=3075545 RepID=A0ABU2N5E7_9PSEU|nr:NAD(P)-dependent oxidoreductase [Pseudonocardia sp. DSM 45834]MDT0349125.1 NAD(P)-dependent oxidoreductase [Pseudonocardia sp. DSM 45834]